MVFLSPADVPIENLHTERTIRPIAAGRKNHYGSRSQRGTFVAAFFYSLIESASYAATRVGRTRLASEVDQPWRAPRIANPPAARS